MASSIPGAETQESQPEQGGTSPLPWWLIKLTTPSELYPSANFCVPLVFIYVSFNLSSPFKLLPPM